MAQPSKRFDSAVKSAAKQREFESHSDPPDLVGFFDDNSRYLAVTNRATLTFFFFNSLRLQEYLLFVFI